MAPRGLEAPEWGANVRVLPAHMRLGRLAVGIGLYRAGERSAEEAQA